MMSPVTLLNTNVGHTVGGETQTGNSEALLTESLCPLVMEEKNRTGGLYVFCDCSNWLVLIVRRKSIQETL